MIGNHVTWHLCLLICVIRLNAKKKMNAKLLSRNLLASIPKLLMYPEINGHQIVSFGLFTLFLISCFYETLGSPKKLYPICEATMEEL